MDDRGKDRDEKDIRSKYILVVKPRQGAKQQLEHYDGGTESPNIDTLRWSASQLLWERTDIASSRGTYPLCILNPPLPRLNVPLKPGARWSAKSSCKNTKVTLAVHVHSSSWQDFPGHGRQLVWHITTSYDATISNLPGIADRKTRVDDTQLAVALLAPLSEVVTTHGYNGGEEVSRTIQRRTLK